VEGAPIWTTEIFDPVQGLAYVLDDQKKIAHRMAIRPSPPQPIATRASAGLQQTTTENPAGAERNGNPTTFTMETWESQELGMTVLTRSSNGYTCRLAHLSRAEPGPTGFQPPTDYTVVDDKDSFTMTVKFQ
jgi:hypothetical protein